MKKHNCRSFFSGALVTLLAVALIGTAAATVGKQMIEVDYKNIHVVLDNAEVKLSDNKGAVVEPFAYKGTTYIPVRAISEALGYKVEWYDYGDSASVVVSTPKSALTPDYPYTGVPRLDGIVGSNAFQMSFPAEEGNTKRTYYQYYKPYFKDGTADSYVSLYDTALKAAGFKLFQTSTVEGYPMYHYVNDTSKVFASFVTTKIDDAEYVAVLVNTEQQKKDTGSSTGTTTGTTTGGSNPSTTDNSAVYKSALAELDAQYSADKAVIEEAYRQAYINYMKDLDQLDPVYAVDSQKLAVETRYESARIAIDKQMEALDAKYSSDLTALNAKYGK